MTAIYTPTGNPPAGGPLLSSDIRAEFQQISADLNDFYAEGSWTPSLSCVTPGNLAITYAYQVGSYTKIGRVIVAQYFIQPATFTHSTASGALLINGMPFTSMASPAQAWTAGSIIFTGISLPTGYTELSSLMEAGVSSLKLQLVGTNTATRTLEVTDIPTGATGIGIIATHVYFT